MLYEAMKKYQAHNLSVRHTFLIHSTIISNLDEQRFDWPVH